MPVNSFARDCQVGLTISKISSQPATATLATVQQLIQGREGYDRGIKLIAAGLAPDSGSS